MQQVNKWAWVGVALSGAITVALGAYAAHGLSARVSTNLVSAVETGVRYQAWHTLAIMVLLVWQSVRPLAGQRWVIALWALGVACFSGSLYLMALVGLNLGIITPFGGLLLIAGWLTLAGTALLSDR
ncbi:DUF423 domain-containing protein [Vreelandella salicampi]|uniref:DUF423 domain-containing protein n=1 Tax=Vreelandella salicampi TaxID=1449798 RepID=A0A7Z0LLN9_9GAMM|nr:DUF423 domain-containing protein [Halomonas salicampi]